MQRLNLAEFRKYCKRKECRGYKFISSRNNFFIESPVLSDEYDLIHISLSPDRVCFVHGDHVYSCDFPKYIEIRTENGHEFIDIVCSSPSGRWHAVHTFVTIY